MATNQIRKPDLSQKKALLIGIKYEENGENGTLAGPHEGVYGLRSLLIKRYDYAIEDIVIMLDDGQVQADMTPTYDNILREIDNMVRGARAEDRFFFAYSGHSGQVTNRRGSEEDGRDEAIQTSDGKDLIDNELKVHLVDPLPLGSRLVAVLDTCHSGSLLDLKHHRCNVVFTPRISKGSRRTDSRWNAVVRRGAVGTIQRLPYSCPLPRRMVITDRMVTTDRIWWHHNRHGMNYCETDSRRITSIDTSRSLAPPSRRCSRSPITTRSWPLSRVSIPNTSPDEIEIKRCDSPTALWECEGDCRNKPIEATETAHVICISACKDEQRAWEGPTGASLTKEFIQILEKDRYPSLKELLTQLTTRTHERCLQIHESTRQFKRECHEESFYGELNNFQDPQIASHVPLNMDERLTL